MNYATLDHVLDYVFFQTNKSLRSLITEQIDVLVSTSFNQDPLSKIASKVLADSTFVLIEEASSACGYKGSEQIDHLLRQLEVWLFSEIDRKKKEYVRSLTTTSTDPQSEPSQSVVIQDDVQATQVFEASGWDDIKNHPEPDGAESEPPLLSRVRAVNWNDVQDPVDLAVWNRSWSNFWLPEKIPLSNDLPTWRLMTRAEQLRTIRVFTGLTLLDTMQYEEGLPSIQSEVQTQLETAVLGQFQAMECFTEEHELLTPNGWKSVKDITTNDKVAQYHPETNGIDFVNPMETSSHVAQSTITITNRNGWFKQRVSPGHRVYFEQVSKDTRYGKVSDRNWESKVVLAKDMLEPQGHPQFIRYRNAAATVMNPDREFSALDSMLVAIQADGSIDNWTKNSKGEVSRTGAISGTVPVRFSFAKQRKIDRIFHLLEELGWSASRGPDDERDFKGRLNFTVFVPKEYLEHRNKKFIDWWKLDELSFGWCRSFLNEIVLWDGHNANTNIHGVYYSCDKDNAEFVVAVASLAGCRTRFSVRHDDRKETFNDSYVVSITYGVDTTNSQGVEYSENHEPEMVYGIEVPSTFLLVRNSKTTFISGNCVHARSYSSIFSTLCTSQEIEEAYIWSEQCKSLQYKAELLTKKYRGSTPLKRKVASILLEMFLFYSGFFWPLYLSAHGKIPNSGDLIKLIIRDESIHGYYIGHKFQQQFAKASEEEQEDIRDYMYTMLVDLMENEEVYTDELYGGSGLEDDVKTFLRYNANRALRMAGFDPLYSQEDTQISSTILASLNANGDSNHDFFSLSGESYVQLPVEPINTEAISVFLSDL